MKIASYKAGLWPACLRIAWVLVRSRSESNPFKPELTLERQDLRVSCPHVRSSNLRFCQS